MNTALFMPFSRGMKMMGKRQDTQHSAEIFLVDALRQENAEENAGFIADLMDLIW
jgi:hypothetical protein